MKKLVTFIAATCLVQLSAQNYLWAKGIGGPGLSNLPNNARSVNTDPAGNVYVTGNFYGTNVNFNPGFTPVNMTSVNNNTDIFFAKYSAGGTCLWAKSIFGSFGYGNSIVTDAGGNVLIVGSFDGTTVDFDPGPGTATLSSSSTSNIFFAKYDVNGNYLWAKAIGGTATDFGYSIRTDASGNAYIAGRLQSTNVDFDPGPGIANLSTAGGPDVFFAKYDSGGNYLWAKSIGGTGNDLSTGLSLDATGNAYITGTFQGSAIDFDPGLGTATLSSSGTDIFFAKYDANGNYVWAKSFAGSGGSGASGQCINTDAAGNTWITGNFSGANVDFDPGPGIALLSAGSIPAAFLAKYDPNGNYILAKSVPNARGNGITNDAAGRVYVIGTFTANTDFDPGPGTTTLSFAGGICDIFFAKYDAGGNFIWARSIGGPVTDYGNAIALDASQNVCIAGVFSGPSVDFDPGPGTATFSAVGYYDMYFAKYGYCSSQVTNQRSICAGNSYAINGHIYTASGTYKDTLYTASGCDSIVITQLTVSGQPTNITIGSSSVLCSGSSNTLTAAGALTYTWSTGAQNAVVILTPTNVTQLSVSGTGAGGCIGNATINVLPAPALGISGKQIICKGEKIFIVASGANSYTWNTGAQTSSISTILTSTTIYTVTGSYTNSPCQTAQTITVSVKPCVDVKTVASGDIVTTVYPNPATTELFYTLNSNGPHRYMITDFNGTKLAEGQQSGTKVRLDLSGYRAGIYILTITVGKASKTTRFVIE